MTMDHGTCPICGGPVTKETWVGYFNMGLQPHRHLYRALCESCRIVLERTIAGDEDTGWLSCSVDRQDIVGELSAAEVTKVEKILAPYPVLLA